jgi:prenyltransferase beta subunit
MQRENAKPEKVAPAAAAAHAVISRLISYFTFHATSATKFLQRSGVLIVLGTVILFDTARGQETGAAPNVDTAVSRGLEYLAAEQKPDGSFTDQGPRVAITGLALLGYLASGDTPEIGKYGSTVGTAIDYLLKQAPADGYFGKVDGSRMYGQAIVTLALAEAWGVVENDARREKIRLVVTKSAEVILNGQKVKKPAPFNGGWRYEPQSVDSDLSLSGWNVLALRACLDDGLDIPADSATSAVAFVIRCHRKEGGFVYQPGSGDPSIASTGAAVLSLFVLNAGPSTERTDGLKFLREHRIDDQTRFPYYAMYYSVHAALQAGEAGGEVNIDQTLERLIKMQQQDGSWPQSKSGEEPGVSYATTMAVLTLEAPYHLLPVYQR